MPLRPLSDRVILQPDQSELRSGQIILPDVARKERKRGTVVAVGPGRWCPTAEMRIPVQVRPGDVVEYGWDGMKVRDETGREFMVVHEAEILCVVE